MKNRIITTDITLEDKNMEKTLRPRSLRENIGKEKVKKNLEVFIRSAKKGHETLDNVLL